MTTSRNPDQLIQAFLADGPDELPDRAFDAVRGDIHRTRQRVVIGPWREPHMSTLGKLAIAAALVVAIGFAWINFGPRQPGFGGDPTQAPTASPTPTAQLITGSNRALEAGRYRFDYGAATGSGGLPGASVFITVPGGGWTNFDNFAVDRNYSAASSEAGASFVIWNITDLYVDPCTDHTPQASPPGNGIDELLEALAGQPGLEAGPQTDVTVDGYSGKYVELTVATDIATCTAGFFPWVDKFVQGNNEVLRVYALDVDGERLTFFARIPVITTPTHRAELESIIASIDIQP